MTTKARLIITAGAIGLLATPAIAIEPISVIEMDSVSIPTPIEYSFAHPEQMTPRVAAETERYAIAAHDDRSGDLLITADADAFSRAPDEIVADMEAYDSDSEFSDFLTDAFALLSEATGVDFDLEIAGLKYAGGVKSTITPEGAVAFAIPAGIDRIALRHLTVTGAHTPSIGSVYISGLDMHDSHVVVTTH